MAKLTLLALTLAALFAFTTATTIITTTINDEYPLSEHRQCSQHLQGQRLNQCHMFLQQPQNIPFQKFIPGKQQQQQQILQQCCQQLRNVQQPCQCEAVKQVLRDVVEQQQQQQQGQWSIPFFGSQQTQQLKQRAQALPNVCNLPVQQQCRIGSISTTVTEGNFDLPFDIPFLPWPFSSECGKSELQQPVTQCQSYVEQQMMQSPRPRPYQTQRPVQGLQQCCNQLQNLKKECQCEAIKEVAQRVLNQQPQYQQQGRWGSGSQQMDIARKVVQDLPNQCYLDVQQCNIPYRAPM